MDEVTAADLVALEDQLGRPSRGAVGIAARCRCGRPLVVVTAPRLPDGTPFPTTFYLTHPTLVKGASTLEARGEMEQMNARLGEDHETAARYADAHLDYLRRRAELGDVPEIADVSAGGMPARVKCLHALVGHSLASGPGVNPFGDEALALLAAEGRWDTTRCWC